MTTETNLQPTPQPLSHRIPAPFPGQTRLGSFEINFLAVGKLLSGLVLAAVMSGCGGREESSPKKDANAREAVRNSAEQGDAGAQVNLGIYFEKEGNEAKAAEWYRKAAEQGFADGQYFLASMYRDGRGVPIDLPKAAEWYRKAAEQGDHGALFCLALCYENGEGVAEDLVQAHYWLSLLVLAEATYDDEDSIENRVFLRKIEKKMTPSQISEAKRLVHEFKPKQ